MARLVEVAAVSLAEQWLTGGGGDCDTRGQQLAGHQPQTRRPEKPARSGLLAFLDEMIYGDSLGDNRDGRPREARVVQLAFGERSKCFFISKCRPSFAYRGPDCHMRMRRGAWYRFGSAARGFHRWQSISNPDCVSCLQERLCWYRTVRVGRMWVVQALCATQTRRDIPDMPANIYTQRSSEQTSEAGRQRSLPPPGDKLVTKASKSQRSLTWSFSRWRGWQ